tara:strand:+ start:583 stop:864 length:282 start_codon:yes stop_codon:yes gene_type:complete
MDDILATEIPVLAGGVYERNGLDGSTEQMMCISTSTKSGVTWGLFRRFGFSDERFRQGSEDLTGWTLISGPGVKTSPRTGKPIRKYNKAESTK